MGEKVCGIRVKFGLGRNPGKLKGWNSYSMGAGFEKPGLLRKLSWKGTDTGVWDRVFNKNFPSRIGTLVGTLRGVETRGPIQTFRLGLSVGSSFPGNF